VRTAAIGTRAADGQELGLKPQGGRLAGSSGTRVAGCCTRVGWLGYGRLRQQHERACGSAHAAQRLRHDCLNHEAEPDSPSPEIPMNERSSLAMVSKV